MKATGDAELALFMPCEDVMTGVYGSQEAISDALDALAYLSRVKCPGYPEANAVPGGAKKADALMYLAELS